MDVTNITSPARNENSANITNMLRTEIEEISFCLHELRTCQKKLP